MTYLFNANTNANVVNSIKLTANIQNNNSVVSASNPLPVTLGSENITITGNVNFIDTVNVASSPDNPVHTHITEVGTSGNLLAANISTLPVSGNLRVTVQNNSINVSTSNPFPVTGNVNVNSIVSVVTTEEAGNFYSFNNHAINTHRGWTMDDTMRPVISFRNGSVSIADLIKIIEYEIGNNNANQSTIIYEWYEGDIVISGAAVPAWTTFGVHSQYRIYQDKFSTNTGNTFTPNGAIMRHSGIIIGKNTSDDAGPASLYGGGTPNMLTLCMRRVDNSTKLDVWFAFTIKELS
jgi:hypothetical protein